MKNYLLITILIFSLLSCRSVKEVPIYTETVIRERIVPVEIPADSAVVNIVLISDTGSNQIRITEIREDKTARVKTSIKTVGNTVEVRFKVPDETIAVRVKDTTVYKEKPVIVEVEKKNTGSVVRKIIWLLIILASLICTIIILILKKKKNG